MVDVLVVEDDNDVAMLMEAFLEDGGHRVRVAPDGEKGLARLTERFPDVVVMDVEMPVLTGPGMAARMLDENAGREDIPVVLVSGATALPQIADELGTPYQLAKPFAPSALLDLVERAARERHCLRPRSEPVAGELKTSPPARC